MASRKAVVRIVSGIAPLLALSGSVEAQAPIALETEESRTLYALGLALASNIDVFSLTSSDLPYLQAGLADGVLGSEPQVSLQEYGPRLQALADERAAAAAGDEIAAGLAFLAEMSSQDGAVRRESGIVVTELAAGTGDSPTATDTVTVHYHGTFRDGSVFDSSVERGEPASFRLDQVISCWTEGVQLMRVGGRSRLGCPSDTAYGDQGRPGIPPGSVLIFEVELISIGG